MLFIEEYEIEPEKVPEMLKLLKTTVEVLGELKLPFLRGWTTYQSREDPSKMIGVWKLDTDSSEPLGEAYLGHPKGKEVPEKFMALIKPDSYVAKHYDERISYK